MPNIVSVARDRNAKRRDPVHTARFGREYGQRAVDVSILQTRQSSSAMSDEMSALRERQLAKWRGDKTSTSRSAGTLTGDTSGTGGLPTEVHDQSHQSTGGQGSVSAPTNTDVWKDEEKRSNAWTKTVTDKDGRVRTTYLGNRGDHGYTEAGWPQGEVIHPPSGVMLGVVKGWDRSGWTDNSDV